MTPHPSLQPYTRNAHSPLPKIWGGRRGHGLEGRGSWGHPNRGMGDITAGMACPRAKQHVRACPTGAGITGKRQEASAAELGTGDRDCWQGRAGLSTAQHGCDSRGGSDSRARAVSHPPVPPSTPGLCLPRMLRAINPRLGGRNGAPGRAQGSHPGGVGAELCRGICTESARVGLGWGAGSGVGWG